MGHAVDPLPALTTLSDPAIEYRVPDRPYVVLQRADVEAVIVDNSAVDDDVLSGHRAGYNGVGALRHAKRRENVFVPSVAGLNFEHIHDGTVQQRTVLFEPRNAPMQLRVIDRHTAELYQPPTPHWGLESCHRYHLLEDGTIEMTFECLPRRASFAHDPQFPLTLVFNRSQHRFTESWYYGVSHGMALVFIFRGRDRPRLTQSPSGGGRGNPAWDFQYFLSGYEVGKRYQMVMRAMYLPYESPEQVERASAGGRRGPEEAPPTPASVVPSDRRYRRGVCVTRKGAGGSNRQPWQRVHITLSAAGPQPNGVGSRFRATTNHMEDALSENDSRPLPVSSGNDIKPAHSCVGQPDN